MTIVVTGGTGFIGRNLVDRLTSQGHDCTVLVRKPASSYPAKPRVTYLPYEHLNAAPPADAVINLAGEWVVGRWTSAKKRRIMESRIQVTRRIVDWIQSQEARPQVFLSASAVGIYGDRGDEILTEESSLDPHRRFRYEVCRAWEAEASRAESLGVRTVLLRTGNVLDAHSGFLGILLPWLRRAPFLISFAPRSWNPWIALPDALAMIEFALKETTITGPLNVVGPNPVRLRQLVEAIGKVIHRPVFGTVPTSLLRLILGEFTQSLVESQNIHPAKALVHGFKFQHPNLESFLRDQFYPQNAQRPSA